MRTLINNKYMPFLSIDKFENVAMPVCVSNETEEVDEVSLPLELHFDKLSIVVEASHVFCCHAMFDTV